MFVVCFPRFRLHVTKPCRYLDHRPRIIRSEKSNEILHSQSLNIGMWIPSFPIKHCWTFLSSCRSSNFDQDIVLGGICHVGFGQLVGYILPCGHYHKFASVVRKDVGALFNVNIRISTTRRLYRLTLFSGYLDFIQAAHVHCICDFSLPTISPKSSTSCG